MARQQEDIQGFRRSHKRIPTRQAMLDDQEELKAKQKAVATMGQSGAAKASGQGPRKPLSSYQNQMNPIGMGSGQLPSGPNTGAMKPSAQTIRAGSRDADPSTYQPIGRSGIGSNLGAAQSPAQMNASAAEQAARQGALNSMKQTGPEVMQSSYPTQAPGMPGRMGNRGDLSLAGMTPLIQGEQVDVTEINEEDPYGWRDRLQEIAERQLDPEAQEERVARQRAAQEAMVRATMGAGEAGRSGAAALLGGEAGRMAESQARAAELERELGVAELGSALMNFDLAKDRYNDAEKRQAAGAVMYVMNAYDVDYDEAFEMLGLPESAKSDKQRETVNKWAQENFEDEEEDEDDEDITEETEDVEETEDGEEEAEEVEERFSETEIPDWVSGAVDTVFAPISWTGVGPAMGMRIIEMAINGEIENEEDFGAALVDAYGESAAAMVGTALWRVVQGALGGEAPN